MRPALNFPTSMHSLLIHIFIAEKPVTPVVSIIHKDFQKANGKLPDSIHEQFFALYRKGGQSCEPV